MAKKQEGNTPAEDAVVIAPNGGEPAAIPAEETPKTESPVTGNAGKPAHWVPGEYPKKWSDFTAAELAARGLTRPKNPGAN